MNKDKNYDEKVCRSSVPGGSLIAAPVSGVSQTKLNADAQPLETDARIIKNIPDQGAALRLQQGRRDQPLWQECYKVLADRVGVVHTHATILDAYTSEEAAEGDDPGTGPYHDPGAGKASREEDRWGWRPQLRDL
ncbi:hypothetical protein EYZ11_013441 [Aspergillus tanneri]|uniref:Uncharacterized protein n=1 Tax=Aspergillus tanneri TaxID=1220188 RepID=A0A4S3IY65_9EURO|nr:hypothetical protein EYZ11_013441 [Aspergillus tanneri]